MESREDSVAESQAEQASSDSEAGEQAQSVEPEEAGNPSPELRVQQLTEQLQRLSADYSNYQKRVQRDRAKWTHEAVRDLIRGLLPALDNLDQAIAAFGGEVKEPHVYREGVELVRSELLRYLKGYDFEPVEAEEGLPFDPDLHQAITAQVVEGAEFEAVSFVARGGYRLGETVLRPAQVGVRKPSA